MLFRIHQNILPNEESILKTLETLKTKIENDYYIIHHLLLLHEKINCIQNITIENGNILIMVEDKLMHLKEDKLCLSDEDDKKIEQNNEEEKFLNLSEVIKENLNI